MCAFTIVSAFLPLLLVIRCISSHIDLNMPENMLKLIDFRLENSHTRFLVMTLVVSFES